LRIGGYEHGGVTDRLHKAHRRGRALAGQLTEATGDQAHLFRRQALAEPSERDHVGKRHRDILGAGNHAGLEHLLGDGLVAQALAHVLLQQVAQKRGQLRNPLSRSLGVARAELLFADPALDEGLAKELADCIGSLRESPSQHPRHLEHRLAIEPELVEAGHD
jgi:hypothetical protein